MFTAEIASSAHPTTTSPAVVSTLGPYRSASAPANGAKIPESQVPAVTAMDSVPMSHPVSSTMYTWMAPITTWDTLAPVAEERQAMPSTSHP